MKLRVKTSIASAVAVAALLSPTTSYADFNSYAASTHDKATQIDSSSTRHAQQYTVQVSMVDSLGNPFFSGFDLVDSNGVHYARDWHYDNIYAGTCVFTNIPKGRYTLQFYYSTYHPATKFIEVQHDKSVTVRLTNPTYTIFGKALFSNGQPVANDGVLLVDPNNIGGYWPPTNSDGTFELWGIPNGTYTFEISNGWSNNQPNVVVSEPVTVDNGNVDLGTLTAPLYNVTFSELNSTGNVTNVPVYLVDNNGVTHLINRTNSDRSVTFTNLPNGIYTVTDKDSYYPIISPQTITVAGNDVNAVLQFGVPTYTITVKILQNGSPYVGSDVHLNDGQGSFEAGPFTTSNDGTFTVYDVAPGSWTVLIGNTAVGTINVNSSTTNYTVGQ